MWKDEVAQRPDSAPEVAQAVLIQTIWNLGGCLTRYHPPLAPQCRPSCVLVGPSRPPSHGHRIPEHPLHSPLDPAGTPPPQVPCEARRVPAPGDRSAGWRRAAAAHEPPPPPQLRLRRTRPPRSVLAVPGRGQTRLPASQGGGDALGPSDRARPSTPGLVGGNESEPCFPGPRRSAPNPTPAPPPLPNTPSGARLTLRAPRGQERGAHCAGGRVGVAVALRRTTSGSARRFSFHSRVCCSSPRVEKRKKEICPVCGPRWVRGRNRGTREQNAGAGVEGQTSRAEEARGETLGKRTPNEKHTAHRGRCERAAAAAGSGSGSKDHI